MSQLNEHIATYLMLGILPEPPADPRNTAGHAAWSLLAREGLTEHLRQRLGSAALAVQSGQSDWAGQILAEAQQVLDDLQEISCATEPVTGRERA